MAAKSSIALVIIPFNQEGASSVIKIAIPIDTGPAIRIAINVLIKVPTIIARPPKVSETGSQAEEVKNSTMPKCLIAKRDS